MWLNNGAGVFADSGQIFGNARSHGVLLADLDADHHELVVGEVLRIDQAGELQYARGDELLDPAANGPFDHLESLGDAGMGCSAVLLQNPDDLPVELIRFHYHGSR